MAYLLTGSPAAAADVLARIERQALAALPADDPARLDRLVIMHTREAVKASRRRGGQVHARPASHDDAGRCMLAVLALPHQPREAWVLARLDELDELRVSRAMDCSRTAAQMHLAAADERMKAAMGDRIDAAIVALRERVDALDPGPAVAAHRQLMRRRARQRAAVVIGVVLAVVLGGALAALSLRG